MYAFEEAFEWTLIS